MINLLLKEPSKKVEQKSKWTTLTLHMDAEADRVEGGGLGHGAVWD
jgi:hypothetical protein